MEHLLDILLESAEELRSTPVSPFDPSLNVLVIDPSPESRTLTARLLETLGHHARLAEDWNQALEMLGGRRFDLVLVDFEISPADGLAATAAIREIEPSLGHRLSIIAMTATADEEENGQWLSARMDGYLCKPLSDTELRHAIDEIVFGTPSMVINPAAAD